MRSSALGMVLALVFAGGLLFACDDGAGKAGDALSDDQAAGQLENGRALVEEAVSGLMRSFADTLQTSPRGGKAAYDLCGMEPAPTGARYSSTPLFNQSGLGEEAAVEAAVTLLEGEGWTMQRTENPLIVEGNRDDGLSVRVQASPYSVDVQVESGCVNASVDLAREFTGRRSVDVGR